MNELWLRLNKILGRIGVLAVVQHGAHSGSPPTSYRFWRRCSLKRTRARPDQSLSTARRSSVSETSSTTEIIEGNGMIRPGITLRRSSKYAHMHQSMRLRILPCPGYQESSYTQIWPEVQILSETTARLSYCHPPLGDYWSYDFCLMRMLENPYRWFSDADCMSESLMF